MQFSFLSLILTFLILNETNLLKAQEVSVPAPQTAEMTNENKNLPVQVLEAKKPDTSGIVKFLAGIPQGGLYEVLEKQPYWEAYRQVLNQKWDSVTKDRLNPMKVWRDTHLKATNLSVFYPMGGPDVLNVLTFFPNSPEYILVGLERIGTFTDWERLQKPNVLMRVTDNLRQGLDSLFQRSFFITQDMSRDFYERGVLPTLLVLLARTGHQVENVKFVTYTTDGQIIDVVGNMVPQGVEIIFQKVNSQDLPQKLYYFRQNLHNQQIDSFAQFIKARGKFAVMFKSSSYTPHQVGFSKLVHLVEEVGDLIVQDDSGLPYANLKKHWDVELYGMYLRPYGESFKAYYQHHLAKLYTDETQVKPLGFRIGYGYSKAPSSIQVARRKQNIQENKPVLEEKIKIPSENAHFHHKVD
ncbi:MAG: hypothetical protein ACRYGR_09070 [Janthinobacterium lividum]